MWNSTNFRLAILCLLPIAEVLAVTLAFDTQDLSGKTSSATAWLERISLIPQLAVSMLTVFAVLIAGRISALAQELYALARHHIYWRRTLVVHFVAFWVACVLTNAIFHGSASNLMVAIAWSFAVTACGVTYLATFVPVRDLLRLLDQEKRTLTFASILGLGTFGIGKWSQTSWEHLIEATFQIVSAGMSLIYSDVICEPASRLIGTKTFRVTIAPECSGYEGLGLFFAFSLIFLFSFRQQLRFPRALLILPLGLCTIWILNSVRIIVLIIVGSEVSEELAVQGFHSQFGWILFCGVAIGIASLALRSPYFSKTSTRTPAESEIGNATAAYLMPLIVLIAVQMVTGALRINVDWLYPLRVIAVISVLYFYRRSYSNLQFTWSWFAVANGLLVFAVWMYLEPAINTTEPTLKTDLSEASFAFRYAWVAFRIVGSCITVPIVEELAFRGYFMRRMVSHDFESIEPQNVGWFPLLVSSIAFGILHGRWIAGVLAGVLYGIGYQRRSSLTDSILAHSITNFCITLAVLLWGQWALWN